MTELDDKKFRTVLEKAVMGSKSDMEIILELYSPLIDGVSHIKGRLDEDLRQYIMMHIIKNVSKFKI